MKRSIQPTYLIPILSNLAIPVAALLFTVVGSSLLPDLASAQSATKQAAYQEAVADLTDAFRSRRYIPRHQQVSHQQVEYNSTVRAGVILQDGEQLAPEFSEEVLPSPATSHMTGPSTLHMSEGSVLATPTTPHQVLNGGGPGCSDCNSGSCGGGACHAPCGGGSCAPAGCGDCGACGQCCIPCPRIYWDRFSFWGGVHGFTSPMQQNFAGQPNTAPQASFGFHQGLNYSTPLPCFRWFQGQLGFQAYQSNFDSSQNFQTNRMRSTYFVTAGIFHRIAMGGQGLQGGAVIDYMQDEWVYDIELLQLRGELSWVWSTGDEVGFWFATGLNNATDTTGRFFPAPQQARAVDLYTFFYRRRALFQGGEGRLFLGWSGDSDAYLGADFNLPLNDCFAIETGFAYLIPNGSTPGQIAGAVAPPTAQGDGWNIQTNLVFYPAGTARLNNNHHRPLMPVANPGNFIPTLAP